MGADRTPRGDRLSKWVAVLGAAVIAALAAGLVLSSASAELMRPSANSVGAAGYGSSCGGYQQAGEPDVEEAETKPPKPRRGRGFDVVFETECGGKYDIDAFKIPPPEDNVKAAGHTKKHFNLAKGVTGPGEVRIEDIGKKLTKGWYRLRVIVKLGGEQEKDTFKFKIRPKDPS